MIVASQQPSTIAVTTYGNQSYYTNACLESIREWKGSNHELIVAAHDPSLLLLYYLRSCKADGLIDKLLITPPAFGHTKGLNLCFKEAAHEILFNISNDILVGPALVDSVADYLLKDRQLGMMGWHWHSEGAFWRDEKLFHKLKSEKNPNLTRSDEANIRNAPWFTGKTFRGMGGPRSIRLCNTAFFGIRKQVWEEIGGFSKVYWHSWADDFFCYALLDQGYNISHFPKRFRRAENFVEFQRLNIADADKRRNYDCIPLPSKKLDRYLDRFSDELSVKDRSILFFLGKSQPDHPVVLHYGTGRCVSLILLLAATKGISLVILYECDSSQPPGKEMPQISVEECSRRIRPFIGKAHQVSLVSCNTSIPSSFTRAAIVVLHLSGAKERMRSTLQWGLQRVKNRGTVVLCYGAQFCEDVWAIANENAPSHSIYQFDSLTIIQC